MATYLTAEKKEEIFAKHGGNAKNTGSTEGQVALFTYRINELSSHLRENKKDHSCRRALLSLVGKSCLLYTSPSPRDATLSRMPSSA